MLPPGNTLRDLFTYADVKWANFSDESEKSVLKTMLAEDLFGLNAAQLRTPESVRFTESQLLTWMRAVKRIAAQEPIQYVTGKAAFYGLMFEVNPSVLIPRPETEELVDLVLGQYSNEMPLHVVDFCTGSGCIPVTLKKQRPAWTLTATDISTEAVATAKKNAHTHETNILFFEGDFLQDTGIPEGRWDVMVSNPPYVAQSEEAEMALHVLEHEPHLALFVPDDDALRFYIRLAQVAQSKLTKNGRVFAELNPKFAEACAEAFRSRGFSAEVQQDLSGKLRFLIAEKKIA